MSINYGSNSVTTTNKITSGAIDITDGYNTLYYYSGGDGSWDTVANWYLDYDHTISAGRIPTASDIVVILNGLTSNLTTVVAKEIIVRDSGYLGVSTDIHSDVKFFDGTYISAGSITGNATFYNSSYTNIAGSYSSPVVVGNAVFKNTSYIGYNGASFFGLSVTFDDDSHPYNGGSLICQQVNINGTNICAGVYYGNVDVTSGYSLAIGSSSTLAVYDGNLTIYKNNIINGNGIQVYNGSLILKDNSTISSNNSVNFYGLCKLVLDNTGSSPYASSVNISSSSYGNYNGNLTIIVNNLNNSYGWMFGGGSNTINCRKLIFNGNSYYYGNNYLYITDSIIFNDNSYWHNSGTNSANNIIPSMIFNDTSYNDGTIACNSAIFNHSSYNDGTISNSFSNNANAIFNDYSQNNSYSTVSGRAIFKGFSQNYGTITVEAWFDDFSLHNSGGYVGGAIYYLGSLSANGGSGNSEYYQNWD